MESNSPSVSFPATILAVDGGGTKTTAWLAECSSDGKTVVIGRGAAGCSNPKAVGLQSALAELQAAIDEARDEALEAQEARANKQFDKQSASIAVFGIAGASSPDVSGPIEQWSYEHGFAQRVLVVPDVLPLLVAGTPDNWGVALVSGTGSVAFGRSPTGKTATVGGWGYLFGDRGSGFAIGRAALMAVTRWVDGRGPATSLDELVFARLEIADASSLKSVVYDAADSRSVIASLAPVVSLAAEQGDEVAGQIVTKVAKQLAQKVIAVTRSLQLGLELGGVSIPLAMAGGVLVHSAPIRSQLLEQLDNRAVSYGPARLVREPVEGCLEMARRELIK